MSTAFFSAILASILTLGVAGNKPEVLLSRVSNDDTRTLQVPVPTTPSESDSLKLQEVEMRNYPYLYYPKQPILLANINCWNAIADRCN